MKTTEKNAIIAKIFAAVVSAVLIVIGAVAACLSMGEVRASEGSTSAGEHVLTLSWAEAEGVSEDGKTYTAKPTKYNDTLNFKITLDLGDSQAVYNPGDVKIKLPWDVLTDLKGNMYSKSIYKYIYNESSILSYNLSSCYSFTCSWNEKQSWQQEEFYYYRNGQEIIIENAVSLSSGTSIGMECQYSYSPFFIEENSVFEIPAHLSISNTDVSTQSVQVQIQQEYDSTSYPKANQTLTQYMKWQNSWGDAPSSDDDRFYVQQMVNGLTYNLHDTSIPYGARLKLTPPEGINIEKIVLFGTEYSLDSLDNLFYITFGTNGIYHPFDLPMIERREDVIVIPYLSSFMPTYVIYSGERPTQYTNYNFEVSIEYEQLSNGSILKSYTHSRSLYYQDLSFVYNGDRISASVDNNINAMPETAVQDLQKGSPLLAFISIRNESDVYDNTPISYSYGCDSILLNGETLIPSEDFEWQLLPSNMSGSGAATISRCSLFQELPEEKNKPILIDKEKLPPATMKIKFANDKQWETYKSFTSSSWGSYMGSSWNAYYFPNFPTQYPSGVSGWKWEYDLSSMDSLYRIQDTMRLPLVIFPTEHVKSLLVDGDNSITPLAVVEAQYKDGSVLSRNEDSAIGVISSVEEINKADMEQYGFLPYRNARTEVIPNQQNSVYTVFKSVSPKSTYYYNAGDDYVEIPSTLCCVITGSRTIEYNNYPQTLMDKFLQSPAFDYQNHHTYYVLLPKGAVFGKIDNVISYKHFTKESVNIPVSTNIIDNFHDSGRQLVRISFDLSGIKSFSYGSVGNYGGIYSGSYGGNIYPDFCSGIEFTSYYPVEALSQYGKNYTINAVYENDLLSDANGMQPDNADWEVFPEEVQKLLSNITGKYSENLNNTTYTKTDVPLNISASYIAGPKHVISTSTAPAYADTTTASLGEDYSYRLAYRTANDGSKTTASDMILFSTLGLNDIDTSAMGDEFASNPSVPHLTSISTYQLEDMGIAPSIYYSTQDLDLSNSSNTDITDSTKWILAASPEDPALVNARRLAIDCTKTSDGSPFILEAGKYIEAFTNMSAPISFEALPDTFTSDMFVQGAIAGATGEGTSITTTKASSVTLNLKDLPISISKSASPAAGDTDSSAAYVQRNQDLDYTITVSNSSNTDYKNIVVEDILPKQFIPNDDGSWASIVQQDGTETPIANLPDVFSYDGDIRTAQITLSSVPRGDSIDIRLHGTVAPDANGTFSNTARIKRISSSVGIASDEIDVSSNEVFHKVLDIGGRKILKDGSLPLAGEFGFSLIRERDTLVDKNIGEHIGGGDGVPDKYQIALTYEVQNGKASFDQIVLTKRNDAGELDETGYAVLQENDIPIFTPNEGYDEKMWIIGSEPQVGQQYRDSYAMVLSFLRSDSDVDTGNGEAPVAPDIEMPLNGSTKPRLQSSRKLSAIESRNDESGLFSFDMELMTADNATSAKDGTYVHRFIMSEEDEGAQGVTYDDSRYMAEVISTDADNDGTLEIQDVKYYKMALDGSLAEVDEAVFVNERVLPIQLAVTGQNGILTLIGAGAVLIITGSIIISRSRNRRQETMYKIEHDRCE